MFTAFLWHLAVIVPERHKNSLDVLCAQWVEGDERHLYSSLVYGPHNFMWGNSEKDTLLDQTLAKLFWTLFSTNPYLSQFQQESCEVSSDRTPNPQYLITFLVPCLFPRWCLLALACLEQESRVGLARIPSYPWCLLLVILYPLTSACSLAVNPDLSLLYLELSPRLYEVFFLLL